MTERTTVRLPEELLKRAKRKAAAEGRTLTSLITDGLQHIVSEPREPPRDRRVLPRISTAKGGIMPGVDLNSLPRVQEHEDLALVGRMKRLK
jgi:hypothetical protein